MMRNKRICFQWNVYLCELNSIDDNVQQGTRPCICVSNDINNTWSNVGQFIPLTSQIKNELPMHCVLSKDCYNFLKNDSVVLTEQLTTLSISNVIKFLGKIEDRDIERIKECIRIQFNL